MTGTHAHADVPKPATPDPDDSLLSLMPSTGAKAPSAAAGGAESSYIDATAMDRTREPDETLSEEAVREHFRDVESSFMPALSPIPTGSTNGEGGVDDTYLFGSPDKAAAQPEQRHDDADSTAVSNTTLSLENLDSSPTAAAAARNHLTRLSVW